MYFILTILIKYNFIGLNRLKYFGMYRFAPVLSLDEQPATPYTVIKKMPQTSFG